MKNIALQLYSIKELTSVDFLGTLEKVADAGYTGVEFAGYFNTPASELKKTLDRLNLKAAGTHVGIETLTTDLDNALAYLQEIECPFIVCPALPLEMRNSYEEYIKTAGILNEIGSKCREKGISLGYHNHDFEFIQFNGQYGFDLLLENTDPDNLFIELDTFWVEFAGLHSVDIIEKYKERCKLLHIKEMKNAETKENTEVGKGIMPFEAITALGKQYQVSWYIVEQERFDIPQLQSIQESFAHLNKIL